jgi:hypothetical protein
MLVVTSMGKLSPSCYRVRRVRTGLAQCFRLVLSPRSPATLTTEPVDCRHVFPNEADDSSPLAAGDSTLVGAEFVRLASFMYDASAEAGYLEAATLTRGAGVAGQAVPFEWVFVVSHT